LERAGGGRTTVLIVDEAHNLEWEVLEEIRLLGNLENRRGKLLQIILSGQQELDRKLEAPEFRQLKQRIALRCTLRGFNTQETVAYINSRMARAGVQEQKIIGPALMEEIHFRAQGIPRLINAICDNLLLTAFAMEKKVARLDMLDEVTADMRLEWPGKEPFRDDSSYPEQILRRNCPHSELFRCKNHPSREFSPSDLIYPPPKVLGMPHLSLPNKVLLTLHCL